MATWIVGGLLIAIVGAIVWKMISDKRRGKRSCGCGSDCSHCGGACGIGPK